MPYSTVRRRGIGAGWRRRRKVVAEYLVDGVQDYVSDKVSYPVLFTPSQDSSHSMTEHTEWVARSARSSPS
jgi:hypothetical protein